MLQQASSEALAMALDPAVIRVAIAVAARLPATAAAMANGN